ncbi:hypothetical protein BN1723_009115 [Verticillium longisporum]|uniref:Uncharacterized protein n=1 Tax=Verticillium longisporum TaxID=100787 RepID=A0A0G4KLY0_VERLO|nr:hypothetical protein BN1723_009115 [Verticillium longisporum]
MSADMHIAPDPGSSASPPAGAGGPNSLPVSLDHPAEEHDAPGPTKPSQPVATLPPPYTAADVPSQTTGAVAGSSDQVSPQPQDAPTKTQTTFLAQVGRWFEAHKFAASCIALFVAFAGLLVAIISVFPSFKSQYLSEEALELSRWTAFKDYIQVCSELVDAVPATLSKKRKRTLEVTFDLEALKTRDGCISTGDAVLGALRILLARVDGAAHTSQNERMGAEHIKGLFSQPASDVVTYLAPILWLCEYSATSDLSCAETQENWTHTLSAIWNLRLHGQTDSLEVALYLSRPAFGLLGKLTGLAIDVDITLEDRVKSSWVHHLESFMHRNLFLPAKSAFLNRKDLEAPIRAVDASRPIASVSGPVFFHLASTTPRILSGPSASTSEEDWAKATFKLARDGLHDLTQQKKSTTLKIMLGEAIANRSHIDLEDLRALCKEHALGSDSTDWQALSLVAQCDPDVFLLTDDGALLLNTVADRLLQPQSSLGGEEDLGAVRTFFDCIIGGYEKARDLSSLLRKWFEQLCIVILA